MPRPTAQAALIVYAGILTAICGWTMLTAATPRHDARFDTITVNRIDVREPDGTLRLAIASRARLPGIVWHGRDRPHAGRTDSAGMLFYNDEGTENGGLIFGGHKQGGKIVSFGHLSFDQYDQDQVLALEQSEAGGARKSGLAISDRPDEPLDLDLPARLAGLTPDQRAKAIERLRATGKLGQERLFLGKDASRASIVALRDGAGRERLRLMVAADGAAAIQFLDAAGHVTRTVGSGG